MRSARLLVLLASLVVLIAGIVAVLLWRHPELLGMRSGSEEQSSGLFWTAMLGSALVLVLGLCRFLGRRSGQFDYRASSADDVEPVAQVEVDPAQAVAQGDLRAIRDHMSSAYGFAWRNKVRLLLVVGEQTEVDAIAPGLCAARWQEGEGVVLLHGGSLCGSWRAGVVGLLAQLRPRLPLDGVVWALSERQSPDAQALSVGVRQLRGLARSLRWQAPLYLWQVHGSEWVQYDRTLPAVGCLLPPKLSVGWIEESLCKLLPPLRKQGLARMKSSTSHDFQLRLSRDLGKEGIARWSQTLDRLKPDFARGVPLRGLLFGLPQQPVGEGHVGNTWWPVPAWDAIREDRRARGQRFGWTWQRGVQHVALGLAGLCVLALLLSYASNRSQVVSVDAMLATVSTADDLDARLTALHKLTRTMTTLEHRQESGVPWYQRFGLSQNDALLAALWPRFTQASLPLLRDEAARSLEQRLVALAHLPPGSPELGSGAASARDQLKAYLMLAQPEKADAGFLAAELGKATAARVDVTPARWQELAPELWAFYARHLSAHPDWRITPATQVVARARQLLLAQLDQPAAEQALYQRLLEEAGRAYVDLRLAALVGDADASSLFDTPASVPGAFTRQAWDGYLREAIDKVVEARREELDWVLSDPQHPLAPEVQPAALQARLTSRYFLDFSQAWLSFLNSIRWRKADGLSQAIDQLGLLADTRRSPLLALMKSLSFQGTTGSRERQTSDKVTGAADAAQTLTDWAPMEQTFGPLLALQGKLAPATGQQASLQAYLVGVSQVRSRLQQVDNAADPAAMAQAMAQATFQGRTIDKQGYGQVVAQSLGKPLTAFAQNLFELPLDQAWLGVIQTSAENLNRQWQREVVADWQRAFADRYPFVAGGADAPLPLLGQMIKPGGRIEQFIERQLGGVLRKQGKHWVPVTGNSQGVRISPAFLKAINQLGELADVLYSDGAMRMTIALKAKPVRDLVETQLIIDGERLEYFNQMESWKSFAWPSWNDHPGVMLTWSSVRAGDRLYGDYPGPWALLRLLEQARVTPLAGNASTYGIVLVAPDGLPLTWEMRTRGGGPLAILKLRDFKLPQDILLGAPASERSYAAQ
ncbi:ImcF-related family protein [Pseudomonas sp. NY15435]|uniref:ImcF-related family protein n=1 Tax=Pseudomonas sp. NY15435 TaxID=3400358 RepID=UPI003A87B4A5